MDSSQTHLIVNYLPQNLTEKEFHDIFSNSGYVTGCKIMKDFKTGYSYGFGFIEYNTNEEAQRAIHQFNGYEIGNKRIKVSFARPSGDSIKNTNLYITNLPRHYTEEDLDNLFAKYGTIVQKKILFDKMTSRSRGIAFVRFALREEAQQAISELQDTQPPGGEEPLQVRLAEEHGKQKAAYYVGLYTALRETQRHFHPRGRGGHGNHMVHPRSNGIRLNSRPNSYY